MINPRQHSALARRLIEACGGLEEASEHCRVNRSVLSGYQNPNKTASMPADVICELEEYCGEGIYSKKLAEVSHGHVPSIDLVSDAIEMVEHAAHLAHEAREAMRDDVLDASERRLLDQSINQVRQLLDSIDANVTAEIVSIEREAG